MCTSEGNCEIIDKHFRRIFKFNLKRQFAKLKNEITCSTDDFYDDVNNNFNGEWLANAKTRSGKRNTFIYTVYMQILLVFLLCNIKQNFG